MGHIVNSYCIFGHTYWGVMPLLLRVHFAIYPPEKYKMYIYHDDSLTNNPYEKVLNTLHRLNIIKTRFVDQPVLKCRAMLWRMISVWDEDVDYVFCKDADSIPTPRERKITEDFISSGHSVLGINDNPAHSIPLMGGMVGFNNKKFISQSNIRTYGDFMRLGQYADGEWQSHGADQNYLNTFLLPRIKHDTTIYRVFNGSQNMPGFRCNLHTPNRSLQDIDPIIDRLGDMCNNYIGACGYAGPLNIEIYKRIGELGCSSIFEFFDRYGNQRINEIIREEEKKEDRLKKENWA